MTAPDPTEVIHERQGVRGVGRAAAVGRAVLTQQSSRRGDARGSALTGNPTVGNLPAYIERERGKVDSVNYRSNPIHCGLRPVEAELEFIEDPACEGRLECQNAILRNGP